MGLGKWESFTHWPIQISQLIIPLTTMCLVECRQGLSILLLSLFSLSVRNAKRRTFSRKRGAISPRQTSLSLIFTAGSLPFGASLFIALNRLSNIYETYSMSILKASKEDSQSVQLTSILVKSTLQMKILSHSMNFTTRF